MDLKNFSISFGVFSASMVMVEVKAFEFPIPFFPLESDSSASSISFSFSLTVDVSDLLDLSLAFTSPPIYPSLRRASSISSIPVNGLSLLRSSPVSFFIPGILSPVPFPLPSPLPLFLPPPLLPPSFSSSPSPSPSLSSSPSPDPDGILSINALAFSRRGM